MKELSEDEKRANNRAITKAIDLVYKTWPVDSFGNQNQKASKIIDRLRKLYIVTENGKRLFKKGN